MPDLSPNSVLRVVAPVVPSITPPTTTATLTVVPGPPGPRGLPGDSFAHRQTAPAAQWTVAHNLGAAREPTVLLDDDPDRPVTPDVLHPDLNTTLIILPSPATGWAYL